VFLNAKTEITERKNRGSYRGTTNERFEME
jgi:hypothetical protein